MRNPPLESARRVDLFHYHLVTSHVRGGRGPLPRQARLPELIARYGRIGEDQVHFEAGVSWDELEEKGFRHRLSELERGAVNVVVQPGQWALPRVDHARGRTRRRRVPRACSSARPSCACASRSTPGAARSSRRTRATAWRCIRSATGSTRLLGDLADELRADRAPAARRRPGRRRQMRSQSARAQASEARWRSARRASASSPTQSRGRPELWRDLRRDAFPRRRRRRGHFRRRTGRATS